MPILEIRLFLEHVLKKKVEPLGEYLIIRVAGHHKYLPYSPGTLAGAVTICIRAVPARGLPRGRLKRMMLCAHAPAVPGTLVRERRLRRPALPRQGLA